MAVELVDLFMLQLTQQSMIYDLRMLKDRKRGSEKVAAFFLRLLDLLPVDVSMEIGAHEATFSRKAKIAHSEMIVRAFEANPNVYAHFLFDARLTELGIDYRFMAIGDRSGKASFHIYEEIMGKDEPADSRRQSCLLRADSPGARHYPVEVPMSTLDSICVRDSLDNRYALWVDAEGFGKQVLEGAEKVLDRTLAIYIELESIAKFKGQALDREIFAWLLERDFVPVLRDFQFLHQYNVIFVKKASLPQVEQELHVYFQNAMRHELAGAANPSLRAGEKDRIAPPPLEPLRFDSVKELKEAMRMLPLLRVPADGLDPAERVVVCHYSDFEEAMAYYKVKCATLPKFYVLGPENCKYKAADADVHIFDELDTGLPVQLFFHQDRRPGLTSFALMTEALANRGITRFHVEKFCMSCFWRRNFARQMAEKDWDLALMFANLLTDAFSQYTYLAICHANACGEPGYIPLAPYPQYFNPIVHAIPGDVICEGGLDFHIAADRIKSSTLNFYNSLEGRGKIWGFEPLPNTQLRLQELFRDLPLFELVPAALWSRDGEVVFVNINSSNCAHAGGTSETGLALPCVSIDSFFAGRTPPSLIKLDVEGSESEVIEGGMNTLAVASPKLMVAIYHASRGMDWIRVPEILLRHGNGYKFFCGHHRPWFAESFVYGVRG